MNKKLTMSAKHGSFLSIALIAVTSCLLGGSLGCGDDGAAASVDAASAIDANTAIDAGSSNSVAWATSRYSLQASDFYIEIDGQKFLAPVGALDVDGDPGDADAMTLELTWQEHGVEMRLNIYFVSDGTDWWAEEIRTYNAEASGDWITYTGTYFNSVLGSAFSGDLTVNSDTGEAIAGKVSFTGLTVQAFK